MAFLRSTLLAAVALAASPIVLGSAPALAATCLGNNTFGSAASGSGANCGGLGVGDSFSIDVTGFFANLGTLPFNTTPYGVAVVKAAGSSLSFTNIGARVTGVAGGNPFTNQLIAIWNATGDNPFGAVDDYTTIGAAVPPANAFRSVNIDLGTILSGVGSGKATPNLVGLTEVSSFVIEGTLSGGNENGTTVVSFGVGPGGTPTAGSTFGGYFTTVPGPLPLAGAAAAFGWSRTLRRRIKAAKQQPASVG
ncbi:hypothetical protein KQ306_00830 [Synechococcus sp. CS-1324]|uniref:hypothetical protein n=1 Tax=Synechococcus sp. CS-1324 TaxID=2847980 RepID=UPI000DB5899F|nr:hypothetical protein [Synechococcus sp. CS-1324]MCT0229408.1 hypothetical protein [Synechococcus sp. CS-1324]PZV01862.1 MAG: hypothetical protein DCF23_12510 [Cyanobium sp.]